MFCYVLLLILENMPKGYALKTSHARYLWLVTPVFPGAPSRNFLLPLELLNTMSELGLAPEQVVELG